MRFNTIIAAILPLTLWFAGCAAPASSVERNARRVAIEVQKLDFDPNTRSLVADNTRVAKTFLQQFYTLGKKDRADGLTLAQARQRVASFSESVERTQAHASQKSVFSPDAQTSQFNQQQYSAEQPEKQARVLLNGATAVYWDGYNGQP